VLAEGSCGPCVMLVATRGFALVKSRRILIQKLQQAGYHVVIAVAEDEYSRVLVEDGVTLMPVPFARGGIAVIDDIRAFFALWMAYRKYTPVLIHHFNAKPVLIGSLAAMMAMPRKKRILVNTVTGLGRAFVSGRLLRALAGLGYQVIAHAVTVTIFQNRDDRELFIKHLWVDQDTSRLVIGSGVDIDRFVPAAEKKAENRTRVLMVCRLLKQKGVQEFIQMAAILRERRGNLDFVLGGEFDHGHPDAVPRETIDQAVEAGTIEFIGYVDEFAKQLQQTAVFVYPSVYREGVPRVVMEAASCGVPVVAADVPGTREAVIDGRTGFLVPGKDVHSLVDRVTRLLEDDSLRMKMGEESRKLAESCFDIRAITRQQLEIYSEFGLDL